MQKFFSYVIKLLSLFVPLMLLIVGMYGCSLNETLAPELRINSPDTNIDVKRDINLTQNLIRGDLNPAGIERIPDKGGKLVS